MIYLLLGFENLSLIFSVLAMQKLFSQFVNGKVVKGSSFY